MASKDDYSPGREDRAATLRETIPRKGFASASAFMYTTDMRDTHISTTELARSIGDILGRLRYRGESFIVEKNGTPIAILAPYGAGRGTGLKATLQGWVDAGEQDEKLATLLEEIGSGDTPLEDPWESP